MTSVLIADDHPLIRKGLRRIIDDSSDYQIVAEAGDGAAALKDILAQKPDIAVLDLAMPGLHGLDVIRQLNAKSLDICVIVLTMHNEPEFVNAAIDLGVRGYVLKENAVDEIVACLDTVAEGRYYVSPSISHILLERRDREQNLRSAFPGLEQLTPMERRILKFISENKTSRQIGEELFLSYRTVQNHRSNICRKLDLHGHNRLLQFALENKDLL